jgi:hypothetical protein
LPFWMIVYVRRMIAFLLAAVVIIVPLFSFAPRIYRWFLEERIRKLYRRLRTVEKALLGCSRADQLMALERELADIDRASGAISMRNSEPYFMFRYHLDRTRARVVDARQSAEDGHSFLSKVG